MGILSINRNILSKLKPKPKPKSKSLSTSPSSIFSSDLCPAAFPPCTINLKQAHAPIVVGDFKSKPMFLIEHFYKGITNYSLLSAAAAASSENKKNSWKDNHHSICTPFPGEYDLLGSCKEWTLFSSYEQVVDEETKVYGVDEDGNPRGYQYQCRLSLWNPTTNRLKTLPPSLFPRPIPVWSIDIRSFGFGFDPKSQDYKLICFLLYNCNYISAMTDFFRENVIIELYSLKTNSWKQITAPPDVNNPGSYNNPYSYLHSVHINGVHYWARDSILSFDYADEKFSRISLPDTPHLRRMHNQYCLAEFHGSLAVIAPYWVPTEDLTQEEKQLQQPFSIEIWVWNGKTWNVVPKAAVGDFPVGDKIAKLLAFFENDYLFLQGFKESQLMLFNCKTGKLEKLGIHHDPPESKFPHRMPGIFPYAVPI